MTTSDDAAADERERLCCAKVYLDTKKRARGVKERRMSCDTPVAAIKQWPEVMPCEGCGAECDICTGCGSVRHVADMERVPERGYQRDHGFRCAACQPKPTLAAINEALER